MCVRVRISVWNVKTKRWLKLKRKHTHTRARACTHTGSRSNSDEPTEYIKVKHTHPFSPLVFDVWTHWDTCSILHLRHSTRRRRHPRQQQQQQQRQHCLILFVLSVNGVTAGWEANEDVWWIVSRQCYSRSMIPVMFWEFGLKKDTAVCVEFFNFITWINLDRV